MITRREQVAQVRNKAVFAVRDVALIPLTSRSEAEQAISKILATVQQQDEAGSNTDTELSDVDEDAERLNVGGNDSTSEARAVEPSQGILAKGTTFTKNVIQDRGKYGRFAERWFSKNGSNVTARRNQGISSEDLTVSQVSQKDSEPIQDDKARLASDVKHESDGRIEKTVEEGEAPTKATAIESLSGRIERIARLYFSTSGFYFSYDLDLSRRLARDDSSAFGIPLWKQFEPLVSIAVRRRDNTLTFE